ncbi:hypothetical protein [Pseudobdellovibrio exovorus]|uniref:Uncharacterized protein n=1 Tax=Pseudobdellovibrio exovorus JSS TaxID=1184267 RepID=M4V8R9_9BACT|nr:hypothetical protein [Pseudobdellovibrio exovorus]AGH94411.1 hypothetical protein A11Q_191 [Pseudobdellovibrio exovorus JSS]
MKSVAGENTDLYINGSQVHVQTEDWGPEKRQLISRVFKNGRVHKTFKLAYEKITNYQTDSQRKKALMQLHQTVIDWAYKQM